MTGFVIAQTVLMTTMSFVNQRVVIVYVNPPMERPKMSELRSSINPKQRSINFYLEKIGIEKFGSIEVFSTAGDIRPPYPYQWVATSIPYGDDGYEGVGATPFEAIRNLYQEMKNLPYGEE